MPTVLIVEDHLDTARALAVICKLTGCDTVVAHDVAAALVLLDARAIALIITDVHLNSPLGVNTTDAAPSGIDLCRAVRDRSAAGPLAPPVVVFSSDDLQGPIALQAGAVAFLTKCRDIGLIIDVLERHLGVRATVRPVDAVGGKRLP